MKKILFILLFSTLTVSFSQKKLPIVKATSLKAYFMEGNEERHNWNISPEILLDIHETTKISKSKWITFYTDIDSIKVKLKPNETFDFIELLNNKEYCKTRIKALPFINYSKQKLAIHDTIHFELTPFNNIKIKAVLNKKDTLNLMFDSATNGLLLTEVAIKEKNLISASEKKIIFCSLEINPSII